MKTASLLAAIRPMEGDALNLWTLLQAESSLQVLLVSLARPELTPPVLGDTANLEPFLHLRPQAAALPDAWVESAVASLTSARDVCACQALLNAGWVTEHQVAGYVVILPEADRNVIVARQNALNGTARVGSLVDPHQLLQERLEEAIHG